MGENLTSFLGRRLSELGGGGLSGLFGRRFGGHLGWDFGRYLGGDFGWDLGGYLRWREGRCVGGGWGLGRCWREGGGIRYLGGCVSRHRSAGRSRKRCVCRYSCRRLSWRGCLGWRCRRNLGREKLGRGGLQGRAR
jgi:hypothetical protein